MESFDDINEVIQHYCEQVDAPNELVRAICHTHLMCCAGQLDGENLASYPVLDVITQVLERLKRS